MWVNDLSVHLSLIYVVILVIYMYFFFSSSSSFTLLCVRISFVWNLLHRLLFFHLFFRDGFFFSRVPLLVVLYIWINCILIIASDLKHENRIHKQQYTVTMPSTVTRNERLFVIFMAHPIRRKEIYIYLYVCLSSNGSDSISPLLFSESI